MDTNTATVSRRTVLTSLAGVVTVSLAGCAEEPTSGDTGAGTTETATAKSQAVTTDHVTSVGDDGSTAINGARLEDDLATLPTNDLSDDERAGIRFMREEEKLAHDLYTELGETFGYRTFENIAASEQTHTEAVALLLEKYDIEDPAVDERGTFSNPDLQSLYDSLLEKGRASGEAALGVGAEVEEVDIVDIQERADATDQEAITLVYENLVRGSRNHLRAFVSVLDRQFGVTYEPRHISQDAYDAIVTGDIETGNGPGPGGR